MIPLFTMAQVDFPDPFSDAIVGQMQELIQQEDIHDLTTALDAYINIQPIPDWYHANSLTRIYAVLMELHRSATARVPREKVAALLEHMREKYEDKLLFD